MNTLGRNGMLAVALAAVAGVALAAPTPASAQGSVLPWVGCWEVAGAPDDAALCVRPLEGQGAVEVLRVEGTQILSREVVWADGQRHDTAREGCDGWEQGTFSADGRRLFLSSEHTCDDGTVQVGAGVMALVDEDEWLDVRSLQIGDEPTAWVQRYRRSYGDVADAVGVADYLAERPMMARAARSAASASLDLDDVFEATERLPAEAVEAWLAETGDAFDLDGETLVRMDDAGVPDRVIDVVVAVSNPRTFRLGAGADAEMIPDDRDGARTRSAYGAAYWGGPFYWDSFYDRRFRYSPFYYGGYGYGGYGGFGYGSYGYGYRPTVIVVEPRDSGRHGRVINGRGYRAPSGVRSPSPGSVGRVGPSSSSGGSSSVAPSRGSTGASKGTAKRRAKPKGGK